MSKPSGISLAPEGKKSRKGLIMIILMAIIAIGAGAGGAWYFMKMSDDEESEKPGVKPAAFVDLDIFTVNLLPEENNQYLQVGLTVKTREAPVVQEITKQMPDIRNRILMMLSSKKSAEITSIAGKQQLSQQIADEIKQSISISGLDEDVLEVLFTSFVIQ